MKGVAHERGPNRNRQFIGGGDEQMGTKVYFFNGPDYLRYDRVDDRADDGFPLPIKGNWTGFEEAGFDTDLDAAVNWGNGKVYFFKGPNYLRYDVAGDMVDPGYPLPINSGAWGNWPASFNSDIDAAINWGNGKVYFFKGPHYLRYDVATDRVDPGYPRAIVDGAWPGWPDSFAIGIDAAIGWGDGKVYFFRGSEYLRYDRASDQVDAGYPAPIADAWTGLPSGVGTRLKAATDLFVDDVELWLEGVEILPAPPARAPSGPKFVSVPWRGVLHTTEGPTLDGAVASFIGTNYWPHFTIDPNTLRVAQHLPVTAGSRALSDNGVPANASRAIQIEIVGFAANSGNLAPEQLAFVGSVIRRIEDLVPIAHRSDRMFLNAGGVSSTPGNRMSAMEWARFAGWCGHQHVPGENHWDPGQLDIATVLL
jgi:hypothetical protein